MSDNIGGIISASYCFRDDVLTCVVTKRNVIINLRPNRNWFDFPASIGNIEIYVVESDANGTSMFSVDGKIRCPRVKSGDVPKIIDFRNKPIIVKYTTGNGDVLVVGDKEDPIKVTRKIINPKDVAGYSGVEYSLSGVMKHSELNILVL